MLKNIIVKTIGSVAGLGAGMISDRAIDKLTADTPTDKKTKLEKGLIGVGKIAVGCIATVAVSNLVGGFTEGLIDGFGHKDE